MRLFLIILFLLVVTGCVQTQELQLAKNVVRISASASGAIWVSQVPRETMRRAAEATIARGYTHFVMTEARLSSGIVGVGNNAARTVNSGATVVMYRAGDRIPTNAFEAATVLANLNR